MIVGCGIMLLKPENAQDCCVQCYLSKSEKRRKKPQTFSYLNFVPHTEEYTRNCNHHPCILFSVGMLKKTKTNHAD